MCKLTKIFPCCFHKDVLEDQLDTLNEDFDQLCQYDLSPKDTEIIDLREKIGICSKKIEELSEELNNKRELCALKNDSMNKKYKKMTSHSNNVTEIERKEFMEQFNRLTSVNEEQRSVISNLNAHMNKELEEKGDKFDKDFEVYRLNSVVPI